MFLCVCPALSCLVWIKDCIFEFNPCLRVPRSSLLCAPWQKTRPNSKRRPLTLSIFHFVLFIFWKFLFDSCLCLSRGKEVADRNPAQARWYSERVWQDRCECRESLKPTAVRGTLKPAIHGEINAAVRGSKVKFVGCRSLNTAVCGTLKPAVRGEINATVRGSLLRAAIRGSPKPACSSCGKPAGRCWLKPRTRSSGSSSPVSARSAVPRSRGSSSLVPARSAILSLVVPTGTVLINLVLSVMSMETRLGQAAGNGLRGHNKRSRLPQTSLHGHDRQDKINCLLLVAEVEAVAEWPCEGPWRLVMPRKKPQLPSLAQRGLPVSVGCPVSVCLDPEGSWYPVAAPGIFLGG